MSVYSGFATRQLESLYNTILKKVLSLLTDRLQQYINNGKYFALTTIEKVNDKKWAKKLIKLYKAQDLIEKKKYMQPYFSQDIHQLINTLKAIYNVDENEGQNQQSTISFNIQISRDTSSNLLNYQVNEKKNSSNKKKENQQKQVSPNRNISYDDYVEKNSQGICILIQPNQEKNTKSVQNGNIYNGQQDEQKYAGQNTVGILAVSSSRESSVRRSTSQKYIKFIRSKTPMMNTKPIKKSNKRLQYLEQQQENLDPDCYQNEQYSREKPVNIRNRKVYQSSKLSPDQTHIKIKPSPYQFTQFSNSVIQKKDFCQNMKNFQNVNYIKKEEFPSYKDIDTNKRAKSRQLRTGSSQQMRNRDIESSQKLEPLFPPQIIKHNQSIHENVGLNRELQSNSAKKLSKIRMEELKSMQIKTQQFSLEDKKDNKYKQIYN